MKYLTIDSPVGKLTLESQDGFITNIFFCKEQPLQVKQDLDCDVLKLTAMQLGEYFSGTRLVFDVPIKPRGGEFFQKVWAVMVKDVPFGKTASYGEIAIKVGSPKGARAVGMANNKNPIPIIIPCHRIVGSNGKLTGFRGGLSMKEKLLEIEGLRTG